MFNKINNLEGQVAVITGAAGGIGFAIAARLISLGATVIAVVRSDLNQMQNRLDELSSGNLAVLADITNSQSLLDILNKINACDILINSAGYSKKIPHNDLDELTDEIFDKIAGLEKIKSKVTMYAMAGLAFAAGSGWINAINFPHVLKFLGL